jgi:polysaccharide biosynthesis transport protein
VNQVNNWELEQSNDMGYGQILSILWRRRLWFFSIFYGVLAVAIPLALIKQPVYQSDMSILAEPNYQGKSDGYQEPDFADTTIEVDYSTQLQVLTSSEILKKAVDKLGLSLSETEKIEFVQQLKSLLTVYQVIDQSDGSKTGTKTKIIQVVYRGSSSTETQKVLEAIKEVYLEYNLEQQEKRLVNGLTFIDNQIPQARRNLTKAENALTELSKKYNLVSPEEEAIALKTNIRQIAQEREALKAQREQTTGTYTTIQQKLGISPGNALALSRLSQSSRYQNLLNQLQETEILLAKEQSRFTKDNPAIEDLISQRDNQKALLLKEAELIIGEIPPNFATDLDLFRKQGQLVGSDTKFLDTITQSQADLTGIAQKDLSLAQTEAQLNQKLTNFPELIAQYKNLSQETEVKRAALQKLLEAKQELEIELSRGAFNWQVIESPQLGVQIAPNLQKDLLLGAVVATFLGGTAVFVREMMDDTISNPKDISKQTALPLLGTTPGLSLASSKGFLTQLPWLSNSDTTSTQKVIQWQPFREALDLIYENFRLREQDSSLNSLAITSATPGEGKSTFILGLALSAARRGQKVLVIDADLRRPSLHKTFNVSNDFGLTNFLLGEETSPEIQRVVLAEETIDLITSGPSPSDPVKILSNFQLQSLIDLKKNQYDLILIDTPPVIGMVDAIKVASICDGTVLIMRLDKV